MDIKHKENDTHGTFYIEQEDDVLGEMIYTKTRSNLITIDHTEVSEKLKGKGAGKQLLEAAVAYARNHNIKIFPRCSFAREMFERITEYQDVLAR